MSNLFGAALLKGLGDGAKAVGTTMMDDFSKRDRLREELRIKGELQAEELKQRAELGLTRVASGSTGGGGAGAGVAGGAGPFNREAFDDRTAALVGLRNGEELRQFEAGGGNLFGQETRELQGPVEESGTGPGTEVVVPPGFVALRERKLAEIKARREELMFGKDYKEVTAGRENNQRVGQLERYEGGSDRAGQAAFVGAGKPPYGGNSDVTRNEVTGATRTTAVGDAEVGKKASEARENDAQARKANRDKGSGGGGRDQTLQALQQMRISADSERDRYMAMLKEFDRDNANEMQRPGSSESAKAKREALIKQRASIEQRVEEAQTASRDIRKRFEALLRGDAGVSPTPTPAPRPAPPAEPTNAPTTKPAAGSAPPPSALKEGVRTTFRNGQVWTLRNGTPTRVN